MAAHPAHRVKRVYQYMNKNLPVYRCMDDCTSYFQPSMMVNRTVRCWNCLEPFVFTERNLRQAKPRCKKPECAIPKSPAAKATIAAKTKRVSAADNILKKFGVIKVEEEEEDVAFQRVPERASDDLLRRLGLKIDEDDEG